MYFFTNTDISISTQVVSQTFGPVNSDKFNCTNKFSLSGSGMSKAFAAQTGLAIVQYSSPGRVNVAIKPLNNLGQGKPSVGLYVYRGLDINNFLNSTTNNLIEAGNINETDLTKEIWDSYDAYNENTNGPLDMNVIGYDTSLGGSTSLESIFNGSQNAKPQIVTEGMFLGNWVNDSSDIGFEIMLTNHDFQPDLDYLRANDHVIDVTGLSGLEERSKREQCLLFLDPAALYGLHYYDGVKSQNSSATEITYEEQVEFYEDLIENFFYNKNRLYIDIRSEYGYSYNFYENYHDGSGNHIKVGDSLTATSAQPFGISDWPLLVKDSAPNTSTDLSDVTLALRLKDNGTNPDNSKPLIFHSSTKSTSSEVDQKWEFIDDVILTNGGTNTDWTEELTFSFPNYNDSGTKVNIPWFIRLHYARQEPYSGSNTKIPKAENLTQQYFGPFTPSAIGNSTNNFEKTTSPIPRLVYGTIPGTSTPYAFIGFPQVFWDSQNVLFGFAPEATYISSGEQVAPIAYGEKYKVDLKSYDIEQRKAMPWFGGDAVDINDGGLLTITLLQLDAYEASNPELEKVQIIGISQAEMATLKSRIGLSTFHKNFITLGSITSVNSDPDISSGLVEIKGVAANGDYTTGSGGSQVKTYFPGS